MTGGGAGVTGGGAPFRAGLLAGVRVATAGAPPAVTDELRRLGADVAEISSEVLADEDGAAVWARDRTLAGLVVDAAASLRGGGLQASLEQTWRAARAVAAGTLIEGGGRLVFVAPRTGAGAGAEAVGAALENLARTLSVEWARFGVTAVAIAPGADAADADVAAVVAYLLSAAGGYFTGCRLDVG